MLLVEDNPGDARLAQEYLDESEPYFETRLAMACTLEEALQRVSEEDFDIVLLDLSLPDCRGLETFTRFYEKARRIPILVLTGQEDEELAREIVKHGGQDCLPKDILSAPLLRRSIRHGIERKHIYEALRRMQRQLIQAEKMESVGRLAAGVAHEVKNPLARILMGIEYLSEGIEPEDPNIPVILKRMEEAVHRADTIIRGLLDFAADRTLSLEETDLNRVVEQSLFLMDYEIRSKGVELEWRPEINLPKVRADAGKLEQVLINLLLNAVQAMEGREGERRLTIRSGLSRVSGLPHDEGVRRGMRLREGDAVVRIEIDDTGPGIPSDQLGLIFDPFFTTKPAGMGTGLGLPIVRKIVDLHRGRVSMTNRPEGGARATVQLPCGLTAAAL
ncbi:MAG TPA: ATP-binding protein [Verrucomicrobiales bacterium]|nr:ATP-binding protein [Verrucomicrobiales bacterium]